MQDMMQGAIAMASVVAALFFLRFWVQTSDRFFLFFAGAFLIDSGIRILLGIVTVANEHEPLFYLPRLLAFSLIIAAIIDKNRSPGRRNQR